MMESVRERRGREARDNGLWHLFRLNSRQRDLEEAVACFKLGDELGDPDAIFLHRNLGGAQSWDHLQTLLLMPITQDDPHRWPVLQACLIEMDDQTYLAHLMDSDWYLAHLFLGYSARHSPSGGAPRLNEAAVHFARAAEHGDALALYALSELTSDSDLALSYRIRAAERGCVEAQEQLAFAHLHGTEGLEHDMGKFVFWSSRCVQYSFSSAACFGNLLMQAVRERHVLNMFRFGKALHFDVLATRQWNHLADVERHRAGLECLGLFQLVIQRVRAATLTAIWIVRGFGGCRDIEQKVAKLVFLSQESEIAKWSKPDDLLMTQSVSILKKATGKDSTIRRTLTIEKVESSSDSSNSSPESSFFPSSRPILEWSD